MNLPWRTWRVTCSLLSRSLFTTSNVYGHRGRRGPPRPIVFSKKSLMPPVAAWKNMTIAELSKSTNRSTDDIFKAINSLPNPGSYENESDAMSEEDIKNVCRVLGLVGRFGPAPVTTKLAEMKVKTVVLDAVRQPPPPANELRPRRPVVTVMGHVDHGKTTLLDSLRNSRVVDDEHGGITQHIGAFSVKVPQSKQGAITFLDTPGHAAFSAMRARGANVTDMVVLVVAADDGVMEQTVESIKFAKEAQVPIVVAVNKMDKPGADPEHAKKGLLNYGVQSDAEGGDNQFVPISALKRQGLDNLLEAIVLQAELLGLQTTFQGLAEGYVIESLTHEHRGKTSTLLVVRGTLRKGSIIVAGIAWCKVRSIFNEWGKAVQELEPGCAAQVSGWKSLPRAGDLALQVETEQRAKEVVNWREELLETEKLASDSTVINEKMERERAVYRAALDARRAAGMIKNRNKENRKKEIEVDTHPTLHVVLKGDTDGSVEALLNILDTYDRHDDCKLDIVHFGVGPVNLSDLELANTFNGIVYAMHVGVLPEVRAKMKQSDVKEFKVIYKLIDDLKQEINKRLPLVDAEEVIGEANVLQEFLINVRRKKVPVAGCRCTMGELLKTESFRLIRDNEEIHRGPLASLKHIKNEVKSIKNGVECGLMFADPDVRVKPKDTIQCIRQFKTNQETAWSPRGFG